MKKTFSLGAFLGLLKENSGQNKEALKSLIFEEAAKPANEADTALIEAAMDTLLKLEGVEPQPINHKVPFTVKPVFADKVKESFLNYRVPKSLKRIATACTVLVLICFANFISTYAFGYNLTEEFVEWSKNGVKVSVEEDVQEEMNSVYDELVAKMASCGSWNLLLPEYLPEEASLVGYDVTEGATSVITGVFLESESGNTLSIISHNYDNEIIMKENSLVEISGKYTAGFKKQVGKHTVYFVKNEKENVAVFTNNLSIYVVNTTYNQSQLEKIILNLT